MEYAQQFSPLFCYSSNAETELFGQQSPSKKQCLDRSECVVPLHRGKPLAARKVSVSHNLYLMPRRADEDKRVLHNHNSLTYRFSISPSKVRFASTAKDNKHCKDLVF